MSRPAFSALRALFKALFQGRNAVWLVCLGFALVQGNGVSAQDSSSAPAARTLRYVRTNLDKYPRFARLRDLLAQHVDELA